MPAMFLLFGSFTKLDMFWGKDLTKTRKAPGALDPTIVPPPPPGGSVKYVTVTQDKSPWLCSERHDKYFFGRAKTGGLGQVTTKKKTSEKKGYY